MARPVNWALIAVHLEALGCDETATIAEGRLVMLDAATTLATFVRKGRPDAALFPE